MKKNIIALITVGFLLGSSVMVFAEESQNTPQIKAGQYDPKGELISVKAKGLVCEFCAKALEKVFLKRKEVSGISVDLTTKEILVNLKEGQSLDDAVLTELITDAGYNIESIDRNESVVANGSN